MKSLILDKLRYQGFLFVKLFSEILACHDYPIFFKMTLQNVNHSR